MRQHRVRKASKTPDRRRTTREDAQEEQERPEVREDLRHWFEER